MQEHVLCDPLKRGEKRKAQDIPQTASTSKTNRQDSVSDADNDSFEELLVEGSKEKESDADDLLEELAEGFGSDDKCGEPIYEKLAKVAKDGMRTKHYNEKIKEISEKYCRPKNVTNLVTPKVNSEIWTH